MFGFGKYVKLLNPTILYLRIDKKKTPLYWIQKTFI